MACAHLHIKHVTMAQYMVSNENVGDDEAWEFVDKYPLLSCQNPMVPDGMHAPTVLHAASHYVSDLD
jgi:hypothetical protein